MAPRCDAPLCNLLQPARNGATCYMERKELPRASRERRMSRMHDCPSRDLDRLHHPIEPLVTTYTPARRPDAHIEPSVLE